MGAKDIVGSAGTKPDLGSEGDEGKEIVDWKCTNCNKEGTIKTIIHPYTLGIMVYRAHGEVSPDCKFGLNQIQYQRREMA